MSEGSMTENKQQERAVGLRWSCGCITFADARPDHMTAKDKRYIGDQVAAGAEVIRATPDALREMPHFLPSECPHEPKGWGR